MDFEIGNILYILITLVAVIIGLLGKKKKPAGGDSGAPASEKRPGFLENLERVLTMDQEQIQVKDLHESEADIPLEEPIPALVEEEQQPEVMKRPSIMDDYDRIMSQNLDMDFFMEDGGEISDALEVIDLDVVPGTDYFEIVRDFDAGTAVVYAAIINRLDY